MRTSENCWRVRYQRPIEYEIISAPGLFEPDNPALLADGRLEGGRRFVVVDGNIARLYGEKIRSYFEQNQMFEQYEDDN